MTASYLSVNGIPTGGAALLKVSAVGSTSTPDATLSRGENADGPWTTLWTGPAAALGPFFLDEGEESNTYGLPAGTWYWQLKDSNGARVTGPVAVGGIVTVYTDGFTRTLIRLLNAAVANMTLPSGIKPPPRGVMGPMPLGGLPPLPLISCFCELVQQDTLALGQDMVIADDPSIPTTTATTRAFVERTWRIMALCNTDIERDYWKDALMGLMISITKSFFAPLAQDLKHRFQVHSSQAAAKHDTGPGFYMAELLFSITGNFNISQTVSLGLINTITISVGDGSGNTIVVAEAPNAMDPAGDD